MPILLRKTRVHYTLLLTWGLIILVCSICNIQAAQSVTLAWDPAASVSGYRLYCGTTSHVYTQTIEVGNTTKTLVSNLVGGRRYFFAVTAYNIAGLESTPSNEVSYLVPLSTPTPTPAPTVAPSSTPPPAPVLISASSLASGAVTLRWSESDTHSGWFQFFYGTASKQYTKTAAAWSSPVTVTGLTPGIRYYFSVVFTESGTGVPGSAKSNELSCVVASTPTSTPTPTPPPP
jgi:hypothetical protein